MNILLYSLCGEGAVFFQKFKEEGHEVITYIDNPACKGIGEGIFWKTEDPDSLAPNADVILFDDNGKGEKADEYRAKGFTVWNGGSFNDKLEHDRLYGMEVCREYGIPIPDTFEVRSLDEVKKTLASEFRPKEKVVIKLDGEDAAGSSFSFIAKSTEECVSQVEHWIEDGLLPSKWSGILQRFVEGVEVSTEAWYDPLHGFTTHNITLEEKKILAGNLGQAVGCSFNTIVRIDQDSRLFKLVLAPIEPLLKKKGFVGQIDCNAIVDKEGNPHALEWTPRVGYDASPTLAWGNDNGYGNKIGKCLGLIPEDLPGSGYRGLFWAGVRLYVPPYPFECKDEELSRKAYETCKGTPILNHPDLSDTIWLYDAMRVEGNLVCAGTSGMIGCAFGGGETVEEAAKDAYASADALAVPNKGYRALDGWKRHAKAWDFLTAKGLVKFYRGLRSRQRTV